MEFLDFYTTLYTRKAGQRSCPHNLHWNPIPEDSSSLLELPLTKEEVYKAVCRLGIEKAPSRMDSKQIFSKNHETLSKPTL